MTVRRGHPLYALLFILAIWSGGRAFVVLNQIDTEVTSLIATSVDRHIVPISLPRTVPITPFVEQADTPVQTIRQYFPKLAKVNPVQDPAATPTQTGDAFGRMIPIGVSVIEKQTDTSLPPSAFVYADVAPDQPAPSARRRLQISSWLAWRPNTSATGLTSAGLLGGSQAGARAFYPLLPLGKSGRLGPTARLSAPLGQKNGKEAAIGISWRFGGDLPVEFSLERRFGLDRAGRDAFGILIATGVSDRPLPHGFVANGYLQSGIVGVKSHDVFADGSVSVEHDLLQRGFARFSLGGGIWGAAQPGVHRLDVGPQLTLYSSKGPAPVRLSAQWRFSVLGNAAPKSGPAITLGTDF
jgi:hypothetical protein